MFRNKKNNKNSTKIYVGLSTYIFIFLKYITLKFFFVSYFAFSLQTCINYLCTLYLVETIVIIIIWFLK